MTVTDRHNSIPFIADMLIMLIPCTALACFFNGSAAVKLVLVCVGASVICDIAGSLAVRRKITLSDMCALVTGLTIAMTLPASFPLSTAAVCCTVAIFGAKIPFGDYRKLPFVPGAVGTAFAAVVYPDLFFEYDNAASSLSGTSLTSMLQNGVSTNSTSVNMLSVLAGNYPGAIGTTCALLFFGMLIYLAIRKRDKFVTASAFIAVCAVCALLFPRVSTGRAVSLVMELSGGMLLFSAVLVITYPNVGFTSPLTCILYGAAAGLLCMLLRYFGEYEEGVFFAVLIVNAISPVFEKFENKILHRTESGGESSE